MALIHQKLDGVDLKVTGHILILLAWNPILLGVVSGLNSFILELYFDFLSMSSI